MMETIYIGISGKAKHGKDTFAQHISIAFRYAPVHAIQTAFADPIKKMAQIQFPHLTRADLWGPSENREKIIQGYVNPETGEPLKIRDVLKHIGTTWGRGTNPNCWIDATFGHIDSTFYGPPVDSGCIAVISDCRFRNEYEAIRAKKNNMIFRLWRPSVENVSSHPSETELDDESIPWDALIINNDVMDDFQKEATKAAAKVYDRFGLKF